VALVTAPLRLDGGVIAGPPWRLKGQFRQAFRAENVA